MRPGSRTSSSGGELTCSHPSCAESFSTFAALKLHCRSHADGDIAYWNATQRETEAGGDATRPDGGSRDGSEDIAEKEPDDQQAVVFVGHYEHHSNLLPWRESLAEVVQVRANAEGGIDLSHLEELLVRCVAAER